MPAPGRLITRPRDVSSSYVMSTVLRDTPSSLTVQDADDGDTTTSIETLIEAAEQVEAVRPDGEGIEEVVATRPITVINRSSISRQ